MVVNSSPGTSACALFASGGVGPGELWKAVTFQAPLVQMSETIWVRHDCCGATVAPLPTMPTYQTATCAVVGEYVSMR